MSNEKKPAAATEATPAVPAEVTGDEQSEKSSGPVVEDYTDAPPVSDDDGPYARKPKVERTVTDGGSIIETYI